MPYEFTRVRRAADPPSLTPTTADRADVAIGEIEDAVNEVNAAAAPADIGATMVLDAVDGDGLQEFAVRWPAGYVVDELRILVKEAYTDSAAGYVRLQASAMSLAGSVGSAVLGAHDLVGISAGIANMTAPALTAVAADEVERYLRAIVYAENGIATGKCQLLVRFAPPSA